MRGPAKGKAERGRGDGWRRGTSEECKWWGSAGEGICVCALTAGWSWEKLLWRSPELRHNRRRRHLPPPDLHTDTQKKNQLDENTDRRCFSVVRMKLWNKVDMSIKMWNSFVVFKWMRVRCENKDVYLFVILVSYLEVRVLLMIRIQTRHKHKHFTAWACSVIVCNIGLDLRLTALHNIWWNKNKNIHTEPAEVECESALTILFSGYFFKPPVKTKTRIKNTLLHLFRQPNNTDCQTCQTSVTTQLSCFVFYPRALCDHLRFNTARLIV